MTDVVFSQDYLSSKIKDNIKNSHETFLKNEFLSIIKGLYSKKDIGHIFQGNYSILEEQIEEDLSEIEDVFLQFKNKQDHENDHKIVSVDEQRKKGTNYMVRERENVREIKIIVEAGHLDDVIERDF